MISETVSYNLTARLSKKRLTAMAALSASNASVTVSSRNGSRFRRWPKHASFESVVRSAN